MEKNNTAENRAWFEKIGSLPRLLICLGIATSAYLVLLSCDLKQLIKIMSAWDVFCVCMLTMSWITFFRTPVKNIRREAQKQDESKSVIFVINLISTFASLLAVFLLLTAGNDKDKALELPISIGGMALSWFLVHTIFTFRYTHMYYGNSSKDPSVHAGGIDFPGDEKPDYIDFAYFSFVIGMTFQVSDTEIHTRNFRRLVLMHSLLSFCFNTVIVALTINVVAGLSK